MRERGCNPECRRQRHTSSSVLLTRTIPHSQQDYYNLMVFFDVVALFVTLSRLLAMHLALKFIDQYKVLYISVCVPVYVLSACLCESACVL